MGARARQQSEVRRLVWRIEAYGFTTEHAVNLAAVELGMKPNDHQWTIEQLERYVWLIELRRRGQFER
jgi:hypothetical protein